MKVMKVMAKKYFKNKTVSKKSFIDLLCLIDQSNLALAI